MDPNLNSIVYFGARSGNGLWKSTDYGVTWFNVTAFKWTGKSVSLPGHSSMLMGVGTYIEAAGSSYTDDPVGIAWITFDSTTGTKGSATPRIFVGEWQDIKTQVWPI